MKLPFACFKFVFVAAVITCSSPMLRASDHADPISFPGPMELFDDGQPSTANAEDLTGGITDLFVFPLLENGQVADFPEAQPDRAKLTPEQKSQIKGLAFILCVRRGLTKSQPIGLESYTYTIQMDLRSGVAFRGDAEQARYGGTVLRPEQLKPDVSINIRLRDDATVKSCVIRDPMHYLKSSAVELTDDHSLTKRLHGSDGARLYSGFRDDPFIFPPFFGTNVVAMVMTIPIESFPQGQQDWIVWATSSKGGKQVDHVGRSMRTQQPRFELLNTLPPNQHVAALRKEEANPSLMRDFGNKVNLPQLFAYRPWDFVPDVMIYSTRANVVFPNGRRLTDDVAALVARYGDSLLLELSYRSPDFPRKTTNDKPFSADFPFLADPWPDKEPAPGPKLSSRSKGILLSIFAAGALLLVLAAFGCVAVFPWISGRWRRVSQPQPSTL